MTREQLDELNRAAIIRNVRALVDRPGHIPQRLLDDLAGIAEQHATEAVGEAVTSRATSSATVARRKPRTTDRTTDRTLT